MTVHSLQSHVSTYISGATVAAVAVLAVAAPHLKLGRLPRSAAQPACMGRLITDQAEGLRDKVVELQARRDWLLHGGSFYAAAKIGRLPDPVTAEALAAADQAIAEARANFAALCN